MSNSNNKKKKKNKASSEKHGITKAALKSNKNVKSALSRLSDALKALDDTSPGKTVSHWREITEDVNSAYKMLQEGAELVKATSTKYTLVGKISMEDGASLAEELQKGCELLAAGALVLHQRNIGCARSTRTYAKRAARGVVATVLSLIDCFIDQSAYAPGSIGAQKTGAVWSACDAVSKVPKGNRTAMRRDLLTWAVECNETMQEFEELIQQSSRAEASQDVSDADKNNDISWGDFCDGAGSAYQPSEIPVVNACLGLIKCSRGSINAVLQSCESAGDHAIKEGNVELASTIFEWINNLHNSCRKVGEGMTDLGSLLYPPLEIEVMENDAGKGESSENTEKSADDILKSFGEIGYQILRQRNDVLYITKMIIESTDILKLPEDTMSLAKKLDTASQRRYEEARDTLIQISQSK